MDINTKTLNSAINHKVRYKVKGSTLWSYDIILEVYRRNIIFENDSRAFSQIEKIEIV